MARGRKPLPTELKVSQGTFRPHRKNHLEPRPKMTDPQDCPKGLKGEAKKFWLRVAPVLFNNKCLTEMDIEALTAMCYEWGKYKELCKECNTAPLTVPTTKGTVMANPLFAMKDKALANFQKLATEFGLTPASRSKVCMATEAEEKSPMLSLMAKRQAQE